jgi:hypothetical protein
VAREWINARRDDFAGCVRTERVAALVARVWRVDSIDCRVDSGDVDESWMYMSRVSEE